MKHKLTKKQIKLREYKNEKIWGCCILLGGKDIKYIEKLYDRLLKDSVKNMIPIMGYTDYLFNLKNGKS